MDTDAAALVARALAGAGTILLAAEDADPERLPRWLIAATRTELSCSGGAPPIQDDDARLLGLPPTSPDAEDPASGTPTDEVRRRLEETDLVADSTARHSARAALTAKVVHPDLDAARRNREAAVTLARTTGDRLVLADALLARAMGDDVVDAGAALKDATEARRIAAASGARTRVALGAAVEQLLARLEGGRPPVLDGNPNASPGSDERAFGKPTGAEIALEAVRRWAAGPLGGAARVLNLAGLTGQEAVIAMVAELATWRAIGEGRELRQERLLGAVVAARRRRPAPAGAADTTRMATALAALLAARRGAELTASDHLVALGDAPRLSPRVGAIAAIAARSVNMDALAARLGHAAGDTSTPARLLAWAPPVGDPEPGVLALFGELLVGRSEAEIRRHLPLLEGKVAAWLDAPREADAPVGLLVAVGTALATVGERRAEAPLRRALAAGELEEVVELRALGALAWTLPDGSDDARAVAARLAARTALRPAAIGAERARPAPPISAREATARMVEAVEGWSGALRRSTPDGGPMAAIESLLGPASPAAARRGLRALTMPLEVREEVGGGVTLTVGAGRADAVELRFQGPLALPPDIAERLLAALAPLTTSGREADAIDEAPDPGLALDAALIAGDIDFMRDVRARFARHELTRETVRSALRQALSRTGGLYTAVAEGWGIRDYQRFMDFLRRNGCLEDFRPFRRGPAGGDPARRHGGRTQRLAERRGH